jgi:hypothetical protein
LFSNALADPSKLDGPFTLIGLSDSDPEICYEAATDSTLANSHTLKFALSEIVGPHTSGVIAGPGTFTVGVTGSEAVGSKVASVTWSVADALCQSKDVVGKSGTITITGASQTAIAGSFDIVMETGDHVTGTFNSTACSGTSPKSTAACNTALSGTIQGATPPQLIPISSFATPTNPPNLTGSYTLIGASDVSESEVCYEQTNHRPMKNSHSLLVSLFEIQSAGQSSAASAPGTFTIETGTGKETAGSKVALLTWQVADANCGVSVTLQAKSGSVTVTGVSTSQIVGTFDVTLESGDHVTGSFNPSSCYPMGAAQCQ